MKTLNFTPNRILSQHHRQEIYEGRTSLLPQLVILGAQQFLAALPGSLRADRHCGEFEIHLVVQGSADFWVEEDGFRTPYQVRAGQVIITFPDEQHGGTNAVQEPSSLYWLRFRLPSGARSFSGLSSPETKELKADLQAIERRVFQSTPEIAACFSGLLVEHRDGQPHCSVVARSLFNQLLVRVVRSANQEDTADEDVSPRIRKALQWINQHLHESISVNEIANQAGLHSSRFRRLFADQVGYSPSDYLARTRIERSKTHLLDSDNSITYIAHALGFSSSQYFSTVFRKVTGMSPKEYRCLHTTSSEDDPTDEPKGD